ncbi:hypothetical protein [Costertonia aggregata]|uniref:Uncharacterized protein n=1 Tax=Costertonia aggregata TaxID=343403 RepID=A0A7H9AN71_9FLAO|nr:hypothetical protein [Costertonia aggregata]QLG44725.1 hypothetical protein HYG79_04970 [Costertonia aggregata]
MTFEEKLSESIESFFDLDKPDYTENKKNLHADFIELISLFSNTDGTSFGDVLDRFFGTKDYSSGKQRDKDESWLIEIFTIIEQRVRLFADDYPFTLDDNEVLTIKPDLNWKNKMYLGMLVSSKLNIFKGFRPDLTSEFETISYYVLKNFLSSKSIVKEFGKNSTYTGNAKEKIRLLAADLGLKIEEDELEGISERNNQERGLDIIGWMPFGDKCMNQLVYLAQCACGKDTESKYHDTRRFENYLKFYKTKPQHIMFIPYSLINTFKNKFYHSDLIEKDFLIFERKRILALFEEEETFLGLQMNKIVDRCVKHQADIV